MRRAVCIGVLAAGWWCAGDVHATVTIEARDAALRLHVPEDVDDDLTMSGVGTFDAANDLNSTPGPNFGVAAGVVTSTVDATGADFWSSVFSQTIADDPKDALTEATVATASENVFLTLDTETPFRVEMELIESLFEFQGTWSFGLYGSDGGFATVETRIGDGSLIDLGAILVLQDADDAVLTGTLAPGRYLLTVFNRALTASGGSGPLGQEVRIGFSIPAPGAAGLLGAGGLVAVRRCRGAARRLAC